MAEIKTKEYAIVINGVRESIDAVSSLTKSLDELEKKISELEDKLNLNIKVNTPNIEQQMEDIVTSASYDDVKKQDNTALEEADKLQRDILATEEKLAEVRDENYKKLYHMKEELKEYTAIAKAQAAREENQQGLYDTNTMLGIKGQLKSIKTEMQTLDIDSDRFRELTQQANELNNKLKEIEQSYGQYGRNVGNYANSMAEGLQQVKIKVGDTERTFASAMEAARVLNKELKSMAVNGQQNTKKYQDLDEAVKQLNSTLKDVGTSSVVMDNLLDTMQGVTAIASTANGFGALFGLDTSEIEQSIQKLVALQNILQGIEVIKKQMQTGEGIGGVLSKGFKSIDTMTFSLKRMNVSMLGTGKAAHVAAIGIKALSLSLKAMMSLGLAVLFDLIVEGVQKLTEWFKKSKEEVDDTKKSTENAAKAYAQARVQIGMYTERVKNFNGTKKQEKKLVDELNSTLGKTLGTYKTLSEWLKVLTNNSDAYCQSLVIQAKLQDAVNKLIEAQVNRQATIQDIQNGKYHGRDADALKKVEEAMQRADEKIMKANADVIILGKQLESLNKKNKLGDFAPQVEETRSNGKKMVDTVKKVEQDIDNARVAVMKEGLNKTITQLMLERNRRIEEAKKTGYKVKEQIELIERDTEQKIFNARLSYHDKLLKEERQYNEQLKQLQEENYQMQVENSLRKSELDKDENIGTIIKRKDNPQFRSQMSIDYNNFNDVKDNFEKTTKDIVKAYQNVLNSISVYENNVIIESIKSFDKLDDTMKKIVKPMKDTYDELVEEKRRIERISIEEYNVDIKEAFKNVNVTTATLSEAFAVRYQARERYNRDVLNAEKEQAEKELSILREKIELEREIEQNAENDRFDQQVSSLFNQDRRNNEYKQIDELVSRLYVLRNAYSDAFNFGELENKSESQISVMFSKNADEFDKFIEDLKKKGKETTSEGEVALKAYIDITQSEVFKSYEHAKNEYENFLEQYNNLSVEKQEENKKTLERYEKERNLAYVKYMENVESETQIHNNRLQVLTRKYLNDQRDIESDARKKTQQANADFFTSMQEEVEYALSATNQKIDDVRRQPITLFNIGSVRKNLKDMMQAVEVELAKVEQQIGMLNEAWKNGDIDDETYTNQIKNLKAIERQVGDTMNNIKDELDSTWQDLADGINYWIQAVGQSLNSVLSSLEEITDNYYASEIDKLREYIDELQEMYDKQEEITREHADALSAIEDELSTARGDRRQQLIDQLNAEMAAQRASLAQQKKIEAQRKREEEKQKRLEHEQAVAKKRMQEAQAYINMAMSISMAAVNSWPIPAIPMMALAAATGAAQIAAIKSQNIPSYGKGGLIEGKSHKQGGVKATLGLQPIELEGNEYIIRKKTTIENLGLLDFVNKSERKLKLEDFIEFYSSNKVRKSVASANPRNKFESGGQVGVPILRTDIDINDRLLNAFEDYSNRPTVVSVVDILDRTQAVKEVRALSGLAE